MLSVIILNRHSVPSRETNRIKSCNADLLSSADRQRMKVGVLCSFHPILTRFPAGNRAAVQNHHAEHGQLKSTICKGESVKTLQLSTSESTACFGDCPWKTLPLTVCRYARFHWNATLNSRKRTSAIQNFWFCKKLSHSCTEKILPMRKKKNNRKKKCTYKCSTT
jgi:hypothetical protein